MSREKNAFNEAPTSWGPPPLTARPEGLLSSLGIQSGGEYPVTLNRDLQPTYELGDWYREYNQTFRSGSVSIGNPMAVATVFDMFQVPDGEIWIVNRFMARVRTQAVNETFKLGFHRTNSSNLTLLPLAFASNLNETSSSGVPWVEAVPIAGAFPIILRPTVKVRCTVMALNNPAAFDHPLEWSIAVLPCRI